MSTRIPLERAGLWPLRALWLLLPLLAGFGFADALAAQVGPVRNTAEVGLWAGWFVGFVALLAPSTVSLTIHRLIAPSGAAAALWATVSSGLWTGSTIGAIGATALALGLSLLPLTGDSMVNGSAYGPERRLALRPPAALLLGPIQLTWLVIFVGIAGGSMSVASGRYLLGLPLVVAGSAAVWFGGRSLHQLSRRWIVFVPAGMVIHDYWSLAESVLIRRTAIASLGPVPLDKGELLDLSGGARGLAILVELNEKEPLALRAKKTVTTFSAYRIVFTPSLPGQLLHEARVRGVRIG